MKEPMVHRSSTKKKILIVDDTLSNLKQLIGILSDYHTSVARDGKQALEIAKSDQPPDVILLDIIMPELDGYEVCRQLQEDGQTKDIPIIFITAKQNIDDEIKGFKIGAVDYITKPVSPPLVKARVMTHLALRDAYQEVKQQNEALIEADEMKQDLERISRHNLKSPINAMIGFAQLMVNDPRVIADHKKYLQIILDSGHKAQRMITYSLGLFQMEQGSYPLEPLNLDLVPIIRSIEVDLEGLCRMKKLTIRLRLRNQPVVDTDQCYVFAEKMLCYFMLSNLIKNALEASPDEQIIVVSLKDMGKMVAVRIRNLGVVPVEIRERFFEKYVTSGKKSATGWGTYAAKLIAETQGGKIGMATDTVKGTEVAVTIPKGEPEGL